MECSFAPSYCVGEPLCPPCRSAPWSWLVVALPSNYGRAVSRPRVPNVWNPLPCRGVSFCSFVNMLNVANLTMPKERNLLLDPWHPRRHHGSPVRALSWSRVKKRPLANSSLVMPQVRSKIIAIADKAFLLVTHVRLLCVLGSSANKISF